MKMGEDIKTVLKAYLKENLKITLCMTSERDDHNSARVEADVTLLLEGELVDSTYDYVYVRVGE